jgi:hypothetical protein
MRKLELYGITDRAITMMQSYLTDRKQKCQLGDVVSTERHVTCGIPQGSIVGPLLFLLYTNDLPECLNQTTPRLFADDTNLSVAGESIDYTSKFFLGLSGRCHHAPAKASSSTPQIFIHPPERKYENTSLQ